MTLKNCFWTIVILGAMAAASSCRKAEKATGVCLHNSSIDYQKRWAIKSTRIQTYDANHKLVSNVVTQPNGYFEINADFTYYIYSDDAPVKGKWSINGNCQFVLNPGTSRERAFEVTQLSDDSLTLQQTSGLTVITQKYRVFKCPSLASLQFRWDLTFTTQSPYGVDTVFRNLIVPEAGYFRLYADASYDLVLAGNPPPPPVTGTWGIANPGCVLILDKNKPNERSYEIQKLNTDSLVIWRKDTTAKQNYLRHYAKHK
ncbi:hypothetical protein ACFS5N_18980 [Mucilaginibacter ximonensis]|uniref:Lipocalin-like domain-containing protein n=1 Tax=Mucilaginibacter ximonensis TaxID=538021 RepID=A0ABW5YIE3_9SPHI